MSQSSHMSISLSCCVWVGPICALQLAVSLCVCANSIFTGSRHNRRLGCGALHWEDVALVHAGSSLPSRANTRSQSCWSLRQASKVMFFPARLSFLAAVVAGGAEASFRDEHPYVLEPAETTMHGVKVEKKGVGSSWEGSAVGASGHLRGSGADRSETWSMAEAHAAGHGSCGMSGILEMLAVKHCYASGGCCRSGQCHLFGCGKVRRVNYALRSGSGQ